MAVTCLWDLPHPNIQGIQPNAAVDHRSPVDPDLPGRVARTEATRSRWVTRSEVLGTCCWLKALHNFGACKGLAKFNTKRQSSTSLELDSVEKRNNLYSVKQQTNVEIRFNNNNNKNIFVACVCVIHNSSCASPEEKIA